MYIVVIVMVRVKHRNGFDLFEVVYYLSCVRERLKQNTEYKWNITHPWSRNECRVDGTEKKKGAYKNHCSAPWYGDFAKWCVARRQSLSKIGMVEMF